MRKLLAGTGTALLLLAAPQAAPAQISGTSGDTDPDLGSHLQPGKPLPDIRPIKREKFDKAVGKLFDDADANRDGTITLAEFNAIISARENKAISERFAAIDANHDREVSLAEFTAWQRGLGSVVLSTGDASARPGGLVAEEIRYDPGYGDTEAALARLILPLTATSLVTANTDYDAGVSRAELVAWEGRRFEAADANRDGWLTQDEIRLYLQGPGAPGPGAPRPPR